MNFKAFKNKYKKAPVEHHSHNVAREPVVSVCVQTYQHEAYIENCLDGILMQKTDFPIEILLGEDASKDSTRRICIDYAEKHPDKIKLFLHHRENNISIAGQPTGRFIFLYNLYSANGRYIALCEGDDYWTDPLKLQKQVDFLEEKQEYAGCFTNFKVVDKSGNCIKESGLPAHKKKDLPHLDILGSVTPKTLTALFRSSALPETLPAELPRVKNGDTFLFALVSQKGKFGYLDFTSGVYRVHRGGTWSSFDNQNQRKMQVDSYKEMLRSFNKKEQQKALSERLCNSLGQLAKISFNKRNYFRAIYFILKMFRYSPTITMRKIVNKKTN